jgi:cytidine deaminase
MKEISVTSSFTAYDNLKELSAEIQDLMNQAVEIRKKAYAPYSQFRVGAALLLDNGKIVVGSNQETQLILRVYVQNVWPSFTQVVLILKLKS